jgi:putative transposase
VTQIDDDTRRRAERARRVGLFRYELIQEVIDPALSTRARGRLVRALAEREHTGPFGAPVRVSRHTIDRWARDWRGGGFEALVPRPARVTPRTPAEVLEVATALKRENPARTAALWGSRTPHLPLSSGIGARKRSGMIAAASLQLRMPVPVWDPNPRA